MELPLSENKQAYIQCDLCGQSCENDQVWSEHMNIHNPRLRSPPRETDDLETIASIDIQEEGSDESSDEIDSSHEVSDIYPCLECEKVFKSKNGMSRHVKINHSYGNGFNCKICSQVFATKLVLKDHIIESHSDDLRINKCGVCDKIFADKATLSQHFKSHRTDRPFKCSVCDKTYKEKRDLNNHEKSHSGIREHSCDQCGKSFIRLRDLKLHIETHSDLKPFKCDACDKAFRTSVNLKIHMKHHTDPHAFECFICEKKFAVKHTLKRHLVTHRQKKNFPCFQCNKAYHFKHKLEHHIKSVHNNERHYECQDCNKTFATKDNLKIHARTHNGERPYQCSMCPRAFSQVSNKQRHELTHKAIKPFKCLTCNKGFYTQYECKRHMLVHETPDGKPFKCTECGKGFVKAYSLRGHVQRIHQGVRHTCTICQKSFKIAFYFQQHMKNHENTGKQDNKNGEKSQGDSGMEKNGCSKEHENKHSLLRVEEAAKNQVDNMESTLLDVGNSKTSNSEASDVYDPTVRPYSCAHCSQSFRREQDMKRHIRHVHKDFTCNLCQKLFMDELELVSHASACPGSQKLLMCPECGNIFSSKANLKRHLEIHNGAEPKQCPQCQKIFRNEKLLKRHQVTHSDERAFQCTTCDKAFRRAEDLVKHTRTHTGEAPYKCRYCEKAFKQCNNRQRHERTHILEKRFKCEICDRGFNAASELKEHKLTHQVPDGKYFKCDLCERGFSHSKSLKSHVKNVHLNPKHGCNLCGQRFPTAREAKTHKKMHLVAGVDLLRGHEGNLVDSVLEQEVKVRKRYRETVEQQEETEGNGVRQEGKERESCRETVEPQEAGGENQLRTSNIQLVSAMAEEVSDQTSKDSEVPTLIGGNVTDIEVENCCGMVGQIDKENQVNNKVNREGRNGTGQSQKRRLVNDRIRKNISDEKITALGGRADLGYRNAENVEANEQIRHGDEKTTNVVCQVCETVVTRKRTYECVEASEEETLERLGNNAKRVDHTTKHMERQDGERRKENEGRNEQTKDVTESDEREDVETRKNDARDKRGVVGITVTVFNAGNNSNASEYASPEQRNDVTNTTHPDEKNDASKSCNKKGNKNLTDTNEAFNDAIRKVLEGKPFICPLCNKGFSSRNGLRHHYYKTHQNCSDENTTMHLYYCHECNEGFKTKKKFWLHDVKVHGLIETSSDESDLEMGAGQRVITTNTTDESKEDVTQITRLCEIENDLRTNRDDTGVEKVDGRLVIQSKITEWFRSNDSDIMKRL